MPYDYKSAYEWELSDWDRHRASVTTPIGIVTILGGLLGFAIQSFSYGYEPSSYVFVGMGAASIVALGITVYQLGRLLHGHVYKRIPRTDQLLAFQTALEEWHERQQLDVELAHKKFDAHLNKAYANAAASNARINASRSDRLYRANRALIIASVLTFLTLPVLVWNALVTEEDPALVRVVNLPAEVVSE